MRSKAGYWIGGGLMLLALVGSILYGFLSLKQTARTVEAFQRVDLPGTATVELEARKYIIYAEGPGAAQSTPEVEVAVTDLRSQSPVSIRPYLTSLTYSFGTAGSAVATVTPPQAGSYEIRASSTDGGATTLALGDSVAGGILRTILGAFAVGGVLGVSGLILVIITGVRHAIRHARRPPGA
ncbi:MAG: hypothetical protein M4D85_09310 [Actinomycetota bacterium]|nr:hypothetical protein [Actinomycetota bacterium]